MAEILGSRGYRVTPATDRAQGLEGLRETRPDLIGQWVKPEGPGTVESRRGVMETLIGYYRLSTGEHPTSAGPQCYAA